MKQTREGELSPDQNVFMQECEQMHSLCELIKKNCKDICDAIDGKLTMDERIEQLIFSLSAGRVPKKWISDGFATNRGLQSWLKSLVARIEQLKQFESNDNTTPKVVFINRLFNPLSYLTAIRQLAARKLEQELDKLDILTEPSNYYLKDNEPQGIVFKESQGVPIYGLHLQGTSEPCSARGPSPTHPPSAQEGEAGGEEEFGGLQRRKEGSWGRARDEIWAISG